MHRLSIYRNRGQERGEKKTAEEKVQSKGKDLEEISYTWEHRQFNIIGIQSVTIEWCGMELERETGARHGRLCTMVTGLDATRRVMDSLGEF